MSLSRLREFYVAELSALHQVEEEILRQLPLLAARASDAALRQVFDDHYRETQMHLQRLQQLFEQLDERRRHSSAPAIRGLAEEANVQQALLDSGPLLDLALIGAGRRIEHYEIAVYSATIEYARRLGHRDGVTLMLETLEEERQADYRLEMLPTLPAPTRQTAA